MYRTRMNIGLLVVLILLVVAMTGCSQDQANLAEDKINVITSFYPLYDFTKKIGGDHVQVVNLVPAGVDPHDWSPKLKQLAMIIQADVFVYHGLGFEGWVDNFLSSLEHDHKLVTVEASYGVAAIAGGHHHGHEEVATNVQRENESRHDRSDFDDHPHASHGYDPHTWLSPLQAQMIASNIKDGLIQADELHRAEYEANYEALLAQLDDLHEQYVTVINRMPHDTLVVSHEAYAYLARDYNLQQMGIMGLSTSSEPTMRSMKQMIDFIREQHVSYILFEELASPKLAQTIAHDLGIEVLKFNTLEGLKEEQLAAGEDYFSVMKNNLESIEKALQ